MAPRLVNIFDSKVLLPRSHESVPLKGSSHPPTPPPLGAEAFGPEIGEAELDKCTNQSVGNWALSQLHILGTKLQKHKNITHFYCKI